MLRALYNGGTRRITAYAPISRAHSFLLGRVFGADQPCRCLSTDSKKEEILNEEADSEEFKRNQMSVVMSSLKSIMESIGDVKSTMTGVVERLDSVETRLGNLETRLCTVEATQEEQILRELRQVVKVLHGEPYAKSWTVNSLLRLALMLPDLLISPTDSAEFQAMDIAADICKDLVGRGVHLAFFADVLSHFNEQEQEANLATFQRVLGAEHPVLLKQIESYYEHLEGSIQWERYMSTSGGLGLILAMYDACKGEIFKARPIFWNMIEFDLHGRMNLYCVEKSLEEIRERKKNKEETSSPSKMVGKDRVVTGILDIGECKTGTDFSFAQVNLKLELLHWLLGKALVHQGYRVGRLSKIGRLFVSGLRLSEGKRQELARLSEASLSSDSALNVHYI